MVNSGVIFPGVVSCLSFQCIIIDLFIKLRLTVKTLGSCSAFLQELEYMHMGDTVWVHVE